MTKRAKLRRWINRDDGRIYQADNRDLGVLEALGLFFVGTSALAWFLLPKMGLSSSWAGASALAGVVLLAAQGLRSHRSPGA
jgi:hypothetical protein